jgi:hypothetical protein
MPLPLRRGVGRTFLDEWFEARLKFSRKKMVPFSRNPPGWWAAGIPALEVMLTSFIFTTINLM